MLASASEIYRAEQCEAYRQNKIAFEDTEAVLVMKRGRGVFTTLRPFPVGKSCILSTLKTVPKSMSPYSVLFCFVPRKLHDLTAFHLNK